MGDTRLKPVVNNKSDLLNALAGVEAGSAVDAIRSQRSDIANYIQASYDALLEPKDEAGVSRLERGLVALRVAYLEESDVLRSHYRAYLADQNAAEKVVLATETRTLGSPLSARQVAILHHVDLLTNEPHGATPQRLQELRAQGLSDADIVTLSQLIAFLSFQVRTLVGLQLLGVAR